MSIRQQTPQIRFSGFSEDWSNLQFFDALDSIVDFRGRTPKKLGLEWSDKGYVALSALNVKNGYIDFSLDNHFGDEELYQKWMGGKELVAGQVLFTTEAPMGNIAQVPDNKGYILSQRTVAFNAKSSVITNDFLAVLLRSPATFNRLESMTSGGTAKGVSQKSMAKLEVDIPPDLKEQTAIGNLFQNIDQTIALQRRKHEQTQTLKKSLLSKMFPKKGQKQPEIRLKGFSGDWVEVKLGNVLLIRSMSVDSDDFDVDIELENIESETGIIIGNTSVRTQANSYFARGDVLFGRLRPYLKKWWLADVEGVKSGEIWAFYSELIESEFIYALVQTNAFLNATNVSSGSKMPRADWSSMAKVKVFIPNSKKEQTAIGQFFKQLDDTVSIQAKQLKSLENLKKALLAKMFV
ncbi:restriction endonuclease subunit S [Psychrobacter celer]